MYNYSLKSFKNTPNKCETTIYSIRIVKLIVILNFQKLLFEKQYLN